MAELISVIVPVYNVEKYVGQCIESICNQTYKELEVILVDDGATDSSGAICDAYAAKDARIRVIHQENQGMSGARNTALDVMTGDYVIFIDSDDFVSEDMIARLYEFSKSKEADIAGCQPVECDAVGQILKHSPFKDEMSLEGVAKMESFLKENRIGTMPWGKLYKAELLDGIRFPIGKYHEDVYTIYQLVHRAKRVYISSFEGYWYRQLNNSIMHKDFDLRHLDALDAGEVRYAFYAEHYPSLEGLAFSTVTWNAAKCHERMIKVSFRDKEIEKRIQKMYRNRLPVFLKYGTCGFATKLFVMVGAVHMGLAGQIYKLIHKK